MSGELGRKSDRATYENRPIFNCLAVYVPTKYKLAQKLVLAQICDSSAGVKLKSAFEVNLNFTTRANTMKLYL